MLASATNEEKTVGLDGKVPYALGTEFLEIGAEYVEGETFKPHVVMDGRLVTGQNPMSSVACGGFALDAMELSCTEVLLKMTGS